MVNQEQFGASRRGGAAPPTGFPGAFTNCFRGMLLGFVLGDVRNPDADRLESGPASQQLCWILDSLIRHELRVRRDERDSTGQGNGIRPAPIEQLRAGLLRWGALNRSWPQADLLNGWLVSVPGLATDRGPTPAESKALAGLVAGRFLADGHHKDARGMFRSLPIAASAVTAPPELMSGWCAGAAGLTHGHPEAWSTAALLGIIAGGHLTEVFRNGPWALLDAAGPVQWFTNGLPDHPLFDRLVPALDPARDWSALGLAAISDDDSSAAVLAGALYLFRHSRHLPLTDVRERAQAAADPNSVAALTGALIGLEQGTGWLDPGELVRHELAWPIDALAQDYCLTLWSPPADFDEMDTLDELPQRYPLQAHGWS